MEDQFSRTKNLIGQENLDILKSKKVMVMMWHMILLVQQLVR